MELTEAAAALTTALVGSAALVAGVVQALKVLVFPTTWQTGRAPMVAAALLAALAVAGAMLQLGLDPASPAIWQLAVTAWLAVYGGAIATHQTVSKAGRIATGTTDPAGPDDAP